MGSVWEGEAWWQENVVAGHTASTVRAEKMNAGVLNWLSPMPCRTPTPGTVEHTGLEGLPMLTDQETPSQTCQDVCSQSEC